MIPVKLMAASAMALTAMCGVASAQQMLPEGRIYAFHQKAQAGCPATDWHIVAGTNNTLSGMIAWDNMKNIDTVTGTGNPTTRTFHLVAKREVGVGKGGDIDGVIRADGWLTINIMGPAVDCKGIVVPWLTAPPGGGNG